MRIRRLWLDKFIFLIIFLVILAYPVSALTVLPINLDQMISRADRIFLGICLSVQQTSISLGGQTLPVTAYTFEVSKPFKGRFSRQVTFKQIGLERRRVLSLLQQSPPEKTFPIPFHIPGIPEYHPGEEVLLFLTAESSIGLTAPIGLFQGAFFVKKDEASGKKFFINVIQNAGLISGHQGPLPFDEFLIRIQASLSK